MIRSFTVTQTGVPFLRRHRPAKGHHHLPGIRSESDRLALIEGLKDGTVDAIATDHAPHEIQSKEVSISKAAFGIVGLETMLPLSLELYHNGALSLREVMRRLTCGPADIINEPAGRLKKGVRADLTLIDLDHEWTIECNSFQSKSKNSPFDGRKVKGRAIKTFVNGFSVYEMH